MQLRQIGLDMLEALATSAGYSIAPMREMLLEDLRSEILDQRAHDLDPMCEAAVMGFMHCAVKGIIFTDIGDLRAYYGRSLEDVYPLASPTFMSLARTYWTFKVVLIRIGRDPSLVVRMLWKVDTDFAGVFFPTPGPFCPPAEARREAMELIIKASGAPFDLGDYLLNNPYLT